MDSPLEPREKSKTAPLKPKGAAPKIVLTFVCPCHRPPIRGLLQNRNGGGSGMRD
jgi:hypothetical protein